MKKNKLSAIAFTLVIAMVLSACAVGGGGGAAAPAAPGGEAAADDTVFEFSIVHLSAYTDPLHTGWTWLAEQLEERSGGRIQTTVFGNRVLGNSDPETAEMVMQNIVQMTSVPASSAAGLGNIAAFRVFDFPFLFESKEDIYIFMDSDLYAEISAELEAVTGVRAMPGYSIGWINIMSTSPINTLGDLEGLRIRTMATDVQMAFINSLGGSATPVAFGELYTAVQQGVVDGLITSIGLMVSERFFEVCEYMLRSESMANAHIPLLNLEWYNSLPDDLREIFDETFEEYVQFARGIQYDFGNEAVDVLRGEGVTVVEMDAATRAEFMDLTQVVFDQFADDAGAGTIAAVRELLGN